MQVAAHVDAPAVGANVAVVFVDVIGPLSGHDAQGAPVVDPHAGSQGGTGGVEPHVVTNGEFGLPLAAAVA